MTEHFVDFGSEKLDLSPGLFSAQFMDGFFKGEFNQPETHGIPINPEIPPDVQGNVENRPIDTLSNDSYSSTNHSSKYSHDHIDVPENQSATDRNYEDEIISSSRITPIIRKGIQKYYDPVTDNNVVYRYEDDPSEYKKARKRVQNRESASRVRSKKRNYVEELESELSFLKKENSDLKVKNAALKAENSLLKQQTCFLERMVMKSGPQYLTNNPVPYHEQNYQECLLPLVNKTEEQPRTKNLGYFRAAPPNTFKKHATLLGMLTILICTYGFVSNNYEHGEFEVYYPRTLDEFKNSFSLGLKSVNASNGGGYQTKYNIDLDKSLEALLKVNHEYNLIKSGGKIFAITAYIIYFIYVLLITNWRYIFKIKRNKTL